MFAVLIRVISILGKIMSGNPFDVFYFVAAISSETDHEQHRARGGYKNGYANSLKKFSMRLVLEIAAAQGPCFVGSVQLGEVHI